MATQPLSLEERVAMIESELRTMQDRAAIEDVLLRYSRALDWLDDAMLEGVFYDDAEIDYGFFRGNGKEFRPILMQIERDAGRRWHFTSQVKIQLDGDLAEVESYNLSLAIPQLQDDPPSEMLQFFGMYSDRMERRQGHWGIIRRKHLLVAGLSTNEVPMTGDFGMLNKIGATGTNHPDYRRLTAQAGNEFLGPS